MQTIMWSRRRIIAIIIISIIAYILLRNKNYKYSTETVLKNVHAQAVWEFSADFSNTKKHLIPYMDKFSIVSESGNYDHWKYSVKYEETLPVWPYLKAYADGHISVRTDGGKYVISSDHNLCYLYGLACSKSHCDFYMSDKGKEDTLYREEIVYECPPLLSSWCAKMAHLTRTWYIDNLKVYFKQK
ncbi:uncharacterized protein LOC143920881 [Arctopsyche grandis]|uniref:uncharacterized protein LOC143920881 n=1 Tax=Arctopsyche grandis TaxID=121162 RepID=UPI00406D6FD2